MPSVLQPNVFVEAFVGNDKVNAQDLANALFDASPVPPARASSLELCRAYETLFGVVYDKLRLMVGHRGIMVSLHRAIRLTACQHSVLEALTITDTGIAFAAVRGQRPPADPVVLHKAVSDLLTRFLDDLCLLIGADLLGVILGCSVQSQRA